MTSAVLERAAQTLRRLLNVTSSLVSKVQPYSLSHLSAGLWLRLPTYPHLSLCRSPVAMGLEVIGWDKGWLMSSAWLCLKWSRFARSQPHSLVSMGLIQQQYKVKMAEDLRGCRSCWKVMNTPANCLQGFTPDFLSSLLPYTKGNQLLTYTSQIWWHDLFT